MNVLALLLTLTTSMIVLRSGERIAVEGSVSESKGVVTFRSGGLLYSLPAEEVERIASVSAPPEQTTEPQTERQSEQPPVREPGVSAPRESEPRLAELRASELRVSELRLSEAEKKRLIAELEKNHSGQPAAPLPRVVEVTPASEEQKEDENYWRSQARMHEENVRRAQENLELLETRASELRNQIHGFVTLGYQPRQFTYQTTQLAYTLEQIPYARLEVTRAERVWQQFREDARRAGIMPGWLR